METKHIDGFIQMALNGPIGWIKLHGEGGLPDPDVYRDELDDIERLCDAKAVYKRLRNEKKAHEHRLSGDDTKKLFDAVKVILKSIKPGKRYKGNVPDLEKAVIEMLKMAHFLYHHINGRFFLNTRHTEKNYGRRFPINATRKWSEDKQVFVLKEKDERWPEETKADWAKYTKFGPGNRRPKEGMKGEKLYHKNDNFMQLADDDKDKVKRPVTGDALDAVYRLIIAFGRKHGFKGLDKQLRTSSGDSKFLAHPSGIKNDLLKALLELVRDEQQPLSTLKKNLDDWSEKSDISVEKSSDIYDIIQDFIEKLKEYEYWRKREFNVQQDKIQTLRMELKKYVKELDDQYSFSKKRDDFDDDPCKLEPHKQIMFHVGEFLDQRLDPKDWLTPDIKNRSK